MAPIKILIINPNTNQSMTDSLREPIESLDYNNTTYTYLTAPTGPRSINNLADAALSATHTLPAVLPHLRTHAAFLVACYSPHPLVPLLKARTSAPVVGIFEASVQMAVLLLGMYEKKEGEEGEGEKEGEEEKKGEGEGEDEEKEKRNQVFGIVSTGDAWRGILGDAIRRDILGREGAERWFGGVETCGLDAGELHGGGEVEGRVKEAAGRLVRDGRRDVGVVVLGCAGMVGMVGMEAWVREVVGEGVKVVDGVRAGVGVLQGMVRGGF